MADKAYITPAVFKWARETAKISDVVAASKVSVSVSKLHDWENGNDQPTVAKAKILANAYRRPFALLFLPTIPKDFKPLSDFRKNGSKILGTASIFIIREIQQKQAWISDVNKENDEKKSLFVGSYSIKDKPQSVAQNILTTLNINPTNYINQNPLKEWIEKAEANGIFISRTSFFHSRLTLNSEEIQGFAIADPFAPFIFINSDDWNASQLFTIVHELAHLWIAETGISNQIETELKEKSNYNPIEIFCNEVAANALMPLNVIMKINKNLFLNSEDVYKIARSLGVSSFSLLVRVRKLDLISSSIYAKLKYEADIAYKKYQQIEAEKIAKIKAKNKESEKKSGPNALLLQLNRNSRLFTQTVLNEFRGGAIEPTVASNLLNVQTTKFHKLEAFLYK